MRDKLQDSNSRFSNTEMDIEYSRPYILITGASSGIGRDLAIALSRNYRIILNGRDLDRLEKSRILCHEPDDHIIWQYDLVNLNDLEKALGIFLIDNRLRISGFIHCAAMLSILPLRRCVLTHTQSVMNVNFHSAMEIIRLLTRKHVNENALSNIIFISTIVSKFGAKGFSAYSASKAALDALMKSLAVELAPLIRANSVLPGAICTPMTEAIFNQPETSVKLLRDYPLGVGYPSDIVNVVDFLLSDKARWITGQQFVVDGGRTTNISP